MIPNIDFQSVTAAAVILFISFSLGKWVVPITFRLLMRLFRNTSTSMFADVMEAFSKPIRVMAVLLGFYFALTALNLDPGSHEWINSTLRSSYVLLITWGLFTLTGLTSHWLESLGRQFNFEIDRILMPFLSKAIRLVILCLSFTVIVQEWGYEVTGFVAGLGLGGLAFALAAKDAISNIFGGFVIIMEKPFTLDDWIETPSVQGTVENISFRSTRVRTFSQALVTVPNSTLANEPIQNWSRMGKRRITFHLRLTYSTTRDQMEKILDKIRSMLQHHPEIHQETVHVYLDQFGPSSLDVYLYFFTNSTVWSDWLRVKEDCMLSMLEILEEQNVTLAFPSTSIYVESQDRQNAPFKVEKSGNAASL